MAEEWALRMAETRDAPAPNNHDPITASSEDFSKPCDHVLVLFFAICFQDGFGEGDEALPAIIILAGGKTLPTSRC